MDKSNMLGIWIIIVATKIANVITTNRPFISITTKPNSYLKKKTHNMLQVDLLNLKNIIHYHSCTFYAKLRFKFLMILYTTSCFLLVKSSNEISEKPVSFDVRSHKCIMNRGTLDSNDSDIWTIEDMLGLLTESSWIYKEQLFLLQSGTARSWKL